MDSNVTILPSPVDNGTESHFCKRILYGEFSDTKVRLWDVCILIPTVVFLCFLLFNCRNATQKLKSNSNPVVVAFYIMVCLVAVVEIARTLVAMTVNAAVNVGYLADKILWLGLQLLLLVTEMSVLVFGIGSAYLETGRSVRRVIIISSLVALVYSLIQCILEFCLNNEIFYVPKLQYHLYAHGGTVYLFLTSFIGLIVYTSIIILPKTTLKIGQILPTNRSFYLYCLSMAILYSVQSLGSFLLCVGVEDGFCLVNLTTFIYFVGFDPLVYSIFLRGYFSRKKGTFAFLYRPHYDQNDPSNHTYEENIAGPSFNNPPSGNMPAAVDLSTPDDWAYDVDIIDPNLDPNTLDIDYDYFSGQGPVHRFPEEENQHNDQPPMNIPMA